MKTIIEFNGSSMPHFRRICYINYYPTTWSRNIATVTTATYFAAKQNNFEIKRAMTRKRIAKRKRKV